MTDLRHPAAPATAAARLEGAALIHYGLAAPATRATPQSHEASA